MNRLIPQSFLTPVSLLVLITAASVTLHGQRTPKVDFRNFTYPWDDPTEEDGPVVWSWLKSAAETTVRLKNGLHSFASPQATSEERHHLPSVKIHFVAYGHLSGVGPVAAVALNYSKGGTLNWDYLYVYKLEGRRSKLLGRLESGSRADGGLIAGRIKDGLLTLDFADTEMRTGDCCSRGFVRVHYRWRDGQFVEEGSRERGDL